MKSKDDESSGFLDTLPYYSAIIIMGSAYLVAEYLKNPFILFWVFYTLVPILDALLPFDDKNYSEKKTEKNLKGLTILNPALSLSGLRLLCAIQIYFQYSKDLRRKLTRHDFHTHPFKCLSKLMECAF